MFPGQFNEMISNARYWAERDLVEPMRVWLGSLALRGTTTVSRLQIPQPRCPNGLAHKTKCPPPPHSDAAPETSHPSAIKHRRKARDWTEPHFVTATPEGTAEKGWSLMNIKWQRPLFKSVTHFTPRRNESSAAIAATSQGCSDGKKHVDMFRIP